jgi:hypothetical protein
MFHAKIIFDHYVRPSRYPPCSVMFDPSEFSRFNTQFGPFTLDACDFAFVDACLYYCSTSQPFASVTAKRHTVCINHFFDERPSQFHNILNYNAMPPPSTPAR